MTITEHKLNKYSIENNKQTNKRINHTKTVIKFSKVIEKIKAKNLLNCKETCFIGKKPNQIMSS